MSLAVAIKGPEGIVLAADSRVTLQAARKDGAEFPVIFDNATKVLDFANHPYVGAVTYGQAVIGLRTAHSFLPEFDLYLEQNLGGKKRITVEEFAKTLSTFFMARWKEIPNMPSAAVEMVFIVGGYDEDEPYGKLFMFQIPGQPDPEARNPGPTNFGMAWGGQLKLASRLIHGFDPDVFDIVKDSLQLNETQKNDLRTKVRQTVEFPIPYQVLPLQDCVDLAIFLIRSTMVFQDLAVVHRGVGGPIDVAVIRRTGRLEFVQRKELRGESR
jgi:20S proteasome alpha/beta subunit